MSTFLWVEHLNGQLKKGWVPKTGGAVENKG